MVVSGLASLHQFDVAVVMLATVVLVVFVLAAPAVAAVVAAAAVAVVVSMTWVSPQPIFLLCSFLPYRLPRSAQFVFVPPVVLLVPMWMPMRVRMLRSFLPSLLGTPPR